MLSSPLRTLASALVFSPWPLLSARSPAAETETLNGIPVEVLARSTVHVGERTIIYTRIRQPLFSVVPPAAPTPAAEPDAATLAEEARLAAKAYVNWQPTVIVHLRPPVVSELRLEVGGHPVTVWTNVDFSLLTSVSQWESPTTVYGWLPTIVDVDAADDIRPADLALTPGPAEYVVGATPAELTGHEEDLAPLDSLLAYHDLHREALLAEQARRAALAAELARQAAEAATKPKVTTIYFWKNENPTP